jgi:hypothetical protein
MKSLYTLALFAVLLVSRTFAQTAPTIASISASQALTQGQSLSLSVSVNGTSPFTYVWKKGGIAISGATASTFSIAQVALTDIGSYTVTVSNSVSSVTSTVVLVDVKAATAPTFYYQQSAVSYTVGDTLSLGANVDGTSPLTFVWKKGGTVIAGATSGTYNKANVDLTDAGSYTVTVSNIAGSATSSAIVVTINALTAPVFNYSPSGGAIDSGGQAFLQGSVANQSGVTFQWYKDNVAIPNANSYYYQAATAGSYTLKATNAAGSTLSSAAVVVVNPPVAPTSVSVTNGPISVTAGEALSLYASANGSYPVTYQWRKDGVAIAGAVSSSFYKSSVTANDAGNYSVVATNSVGSLTSPATVVSVTTAQLPIITYHPQSLAAYPGDSVSLSVNATGTGPLSFVWKKNGTTVANSNSSYLQVSYQVISADAGDYSVTVSNAQGSVTSQPATLTVLPGVAPVIINQPASVSVLQGQALGFSVYATGRPAPTYQWKKDGVAIVGAIYSSYSASNVASSDSGTYSVVVTNSAGTATSVDATGTVGVAGPPVITGHPASASILLNDYFNGLWVNVANQTGCTFQWYRDGVLLPGATNYSFSIYGAQPAHAGTYHVVVTNAVGSVTSKDAVVTVDLSSARPVITYVAGSQSVMGGSYVQPSINVAPGVTNYTVAWKKNGVVVPNATSLYMTISPFDLTLEGTYTAEVTASGTTYTSRPIDLALLNKDLIPRITTQPASANIKEGDSVSFSIQVDGEAPFTFQWYKGGILIPGATGNSYNLYATTAATAGNYSVTVANRNGSVPSSVASLAITTAATGGVPIIYGQPVSQTLTAGNSYFSMGINLVNPTNTDTYQWYKDGVAIPNATNASVAYYASVTSATAGRYKVVVTNAAGSTTSGEALVTVTTRATGPVFSVQPSDRTGYMGSSVTFTAKATSTSTVSYQWRKDGAAITGAIGASLTLNSLQASDAGGYTVVATDSDGSTPSGVALLTIAAATAPTITSQPIPQVSGLTGSVKFTVAATGNPDPTFQWRKDGVNITAATSATLSLTNLVAGDAATYSVVVTNPAGSVTSSGASLVVYDQLPTTPAFSVQPQSRTATPGEIVSLTVTVTGFPTPTLQWYKNNIAIDGAMSATLALGSITAASAGQYYVVANNVMGATQSTTATVTYAASPFAGTYFGTLSTGEGWALKVEDDGTGTFLGYMSAAGKIIYVDGVKVSPTGAFTFGQASSGNSGGFHAKDQVSALDVPSVAGHSFTGLVSGQISGGAVTGQVAGVTGSFTGKAITASSGAVAGNYNAVPLASGLGEIHAIVAPDGAVLLVAVDGAGVRGGTGTTTAAGAFSITQPQFTYSGNFLAASGAISGTYQPTGGTPVVIAPQPSAGLGLERLVNVSTRGLAGTGSKTMIVGFVIAGSTPQDVLLRAVGPTLTTFGVKGVLVNPRLKIFKGSTPVIENDDWSANGSGSDIIAADTRLGAYPLPAGSADAAVLAHLDPGAYTAQVTTSDNSTGIALIEVYDAALVGANGSKVVNLSARGSVGTGDDVLIIGFVINGSVPKKVLIRGLGPSLTPLGVSGALADPMLRLFHDGTKLTENDNWSAGTDAADITTAAGTVGAFAIASGTKDSALLVYLAPGVYSAQVTGVNNTTGVGLVEVYEVP